MKNKKEKELSTSEKDKKKIAKILIGCGIGLLILGFIVLSMVNRMATNWAGFAAPALILAGWIVIAVGLWKIEGEDQNENSGSK